MVRRGMGLWRAVLLTLGICLVVGTVACGGWSGEPVQTTATRDNSMTSQSLDSRVANATYVFIGTETASVNHEGIQGYHYILHTFQVDRMLKEGYPWDGGPIVIQELNDSSVEVDPDYDWNVINGADRCLIFVYSFAPIDLTLPGNSLGLGIPLDASGSLVEDRSKRRYLEGWLPELAGEAFARDPAAAVLASPGLKLPPPFPYRHIRVNESDDLGDLIAASDLVVRTRISKVEGFIWWCRLDRIGDPLKWKSRLPLPDIVSLGVFQPEPKTEYLLFLRSDGTHFYPAAGEGELSVISERDPVRWQAALSLLGRSD